jgi:predicted glycogen debranching enzyme
MNSRFRFLAVVKSICIVGRYSGACRAVFICHVFFFCFCWAPSPLFTREWLVPNGIGGFASGTVAGAVTRRYHAFLCAATRAPQERRVLVSKIEERVRVGEETFELGANFWPGVVAPRGDLLLESFDLDPLPRWVYRIESARGVVRLQKEIWMPRESNTSVARYTLLEGPDVEIEVRPFVVCRDYHQNHRASDNFNTQPEASQQQLALRPYGDLPPVVLGFEGEWCSSGAWYFGFQWPIEAERGLDASEDAWCPGFALLTLSEGSDALFVASTEAQNLSSIRETRVEAVERARSMGESGEWNAPENRLKRSADAFIVRREDGLKTVLAGYPWFTDWGRDTMIALPGLCLTTRRFDIAASILQAFASSMSQGMIPNRFPDAGETPDYNTVDATLWFFHAIGEYARTSGDFDLVRALYPKLVESVEWHLAGTRFGIQADDDDGMLRAGDAQSQLTWMDAKIGDTAFTPRAGKPVEIQALWFNALWEMAALAKRFGDEATAGICSEWHRKITANFERLFWNEGENCLFDFVDETHRDGAIRPNQIFAVSSRIVCFRARRNAPSWKPCSANCSRRMDYVRCRRAIRAIAERISATRGIAIRRIIRARSGVG